MIEFAQVGRDWQLAYLSTWSTFKEMEKRLFRVLLVDDFHPFRRLIRSKVQAQSYLEVIGEAGDGLEAIQKA
jgi:hypothetical protein